MKSAIIITSDVKQIMFTPENDNEKRALEFLKDPDSNIKILYKSGTFYDDTPHAMGYDVEMCKAKYLRAFTDKDSLMIVMIKKETKDE